jgi:non-homologous end joining protein Ku
LRSSHDTLLAAGRAACHQPWVAVIREAIRQEGMVAIGKVVFTSREHIIALEARDKGLLGHANGV